MNVFVGHEHSSLPGASIISVLLAAFFLKPFLAWPLMAFKLAKLGTKEVGRGWITEVLVGHTLHPELEP